MCGVSLKDRRKSEELQRQLGIECVSDVMRHGRLRWYGHVERADRDKWISKCRTLEIEGTRGRGRGKKKWAEVVEKDMKTLGLKKTDV